jgi:hypothetical protein
MRHPALLLAPLALATALLGGCASSAGNPSPEPLFTEGEVSEPTEAPEPTGEPEPPDAIDACALLPLAEAEVVAGTPLQAGVAGNPDSPSCTYTGPVDGPTAQVEVYAGDGAKKIYDIDVELAHTFTPVSGLGDEAYEEENAIFVRSGTTWVAIRLVLLNDPAQNVAPLENAARAAAGRL